MCLLQCVMTFSFELFLLSPAHEVGAGDIVPPPPPARRPWSRGEGYCHSHVWRAAVRPRFDSGRYLGNICWIVFILHTHIP